MFDYKNWLQSVLGTLSVPYSYGYVQNSSTAWVVALCYNIVGSAWTDNKEDQTRYSIQVTVYSQDDNSSIVEEVKSKMIQAGASRISESDSFDPISNFLQTTIIFYYERNVE